MRRLVRSQQAIADRLKAIGLIPKPIKAVRYRLEMDARLVNVCLTGASLGLWRCPSDRVCVSMPDWAGQTIVSSRRVGGWLSPLSYFQVSRMSCRSAFGALLSCSFTSICIGIGGSS